MVEMVQEGAHYGGNGSRGSITMVEMVQEGALSLAGGRIIGGSEYHLPSGVLHVTQNMREKWGPVRTPEMPLLEP